MSARQASTDEKTYVGKVDDKADTEHKKTMSVSNHQGMPLVCNCDDEPMNWPTITNVLHLSLHEAKIFKNPNVQKPRVIDREQ